MEIEGVTRFNVDGELHAGRPAGIRVEAGALELVVPVC
jgi:diacylglycerol kinase family enzyme